MAVAETDGSLAGPALAAAAAAVAATLTPRGQSRFGGGNNVTNAPSVGVRTAIPRNDAAPASASDADVLNSESFRRAATSGLLRDMSSNWHDAGRVRRKGAIG